MKKQLIVRTYDQIGDLLALDRPQECLLCRPSDTHIGLKNLQMLCEWWLSPVQQSQWNIRTLVQGNQSTEDDSDVLLPNMDALFKAQFGEGAIQYPIFLVINQHHPEKNYPHYQLQIPTGDFLKSIKGYPSEVELRKLYNACAKQTKPLSYKKLKSVSLHTAFSQPDTSLIQTSLSQFIDGINRYLR